MNNRIAICPTNQWSSGVWHDAKDAFVRGYPRQFTDDLPPDTVEEILASEYLASFLAAAWPAGAA